MARYKRYNYDQLMMVPVSLEDQLVPGTLEYAIHHIIEERLDLSFFDERYCNDETGRKAIDPKVINKDYFIRIFPWDAFVSVIRESLPGKHYIYGPFMWAKTRSQHDSCFCIFN